MASNKIWIQRIIILTLRIHIQSIVIYLYALILILIETNYEYNTVNNLRLMRIKGDLDLEIFILKKDKSFKYYICTIEIVKQPIIMLQLKRRYHFIQNRLTKD